MVAVEKHRIEPIDRWQRIEAQGLVKDQMLAVLLLPGSNVVLR